MQHFAFLLERLDEHLLATAEDVAAAEQVVAEARAALQLASRDRRVLDRLKDRHAERWQESELQRDRVAMDEIALNRFTRTRPASDVSAGAADAAGDAGAVQRPTHRRRHARCRNLARIRPDRSPVHTAGRSGHRRRHLMLKSILLPAVLALVVSLAGSAGYTVMQARTMHAAWLVTQDSLALAHADSAAHDSTAHDGTAPDGGHEADGAHASDSSAHGADSTAHGADDHGIPSLDHATTPADSIRALIAERERSGSKAPTNTQANTGAKAAAPPKATAQAMSASAMPAGPPTAAKDAAKDAAKGPARADSVGGPAVDMTTPKVATGESIADVLPERRLAKIFGAMSARDATKVLEQMSDRDIRTILSMMGDRQAAAVLAAFPAARAAAISKGSAKAEPGSVTP